MTAKEYYEAYKTEMENTWTRIEEVAVCNKMLESYAKEAISLRKIRNVSSMTSFVSIKKELHCKWIKMARLFADSFGRDVVPVNGFLSAINDYLPKKVLIDTSAADDFTGGI